jgi:hypothetical protein
MRVEPKPRTPPAVVEAAREKVLVGEEIAGERWGAAMPRMERKMMMDIGRREREKMWRARIPRKDGCWKKEADQK